MKLKSSCETGCMNFHGGEIRHHKDCAFYPDSLSERYERQESELTHLRSDRDSWRHACGVNADASGRLIEVVEGLERENSQLKREIKESRGRADEESQNYVEMMDLRDAEIRKNTTLSQAVEDMAEALKSYAGQGKYSEWEDGVRYLTFDKFGFLCAETAGPWEARQVLARCASVIEFARAKKGAT